ncbi:MAG: hypothetical protein O2999_01720 [Nitrospirae bacterium]|nr:hypothetical protein [Nitrospirota bacterium]MDA1303019.1 hypothetical protein [Nitrospirota bacterium]
MSTAKGRRCLCKPFRQSQGTPLAAFFNIPMNAGFMACFDSEDHEA